MSFGDKMGPKVMTLKSFSYQENYIVVVYVCILLLYSSFERVLIIHMAYKVFQGYINLVPLPISSVCLSIRQLLDQSFALMVFIAYISVTTQQIFFIFGP